MKLKSVKKIISFIVLMLVMLSGCTAAQNDHYEEAMKYMENGDKANIQAMKIRDVIQNSGTLKRYKINVQVYL